MTWYAFAVKACEIILCKLCDSASVDQELINGLINRAAFSRETFTFWANTPLMNNPPGC